MKEFWVEILAAGRWTDASGKDVAFTTADLEGIAAAHAATYPELEPPLRLGDHPGLDSGVKPAVGWVQKVKVEGDKLLGLFTDVPEIVRKAFDAKLYKNVSSGLWRNWRFKGQTYPWALNHVAILGAELPAVKGLADLQAYMADGQALAVPDSVYCFTRSQEGPKMPTDLETKLQADLARAQADLAQATTNLTTASESLKVVTKERDDLKAANEKLQKDAADLTDKGYQAEVAAIVDAAVKDLRLLPADRDKAIKAGCALRPAAGVNFKAGDGSAYDAWVSMLGNAGKAVDLSDKSRQGDPQADKQDAEMEAGRNAALRATGRASEIEKKV